MSMKIKQTLCEPQTVVLRTNSLAAYNSTFAIGGVSCSEYSFVVTKSLYLRLNIRGVNPAHRKSAERQTVQKRLIN